MPADRRPVPAPDLAALDLPLLDALPDVRLVAVDMDGTLLDEQHRLPETLWPLLEELRGRGVLFCPASGRQYATLARQFGDAAGSLLFIAENGSYVVQGGEELSSDPLDRGVVVRLVQVLRRLSAAGVDLGVVVCGKRSAYVERADAAFLAEVDRYYALRQVVPDLTDVADEVLKVAVFDFGSAAETTAPGLEAFRATHQVVVSGSSWVDVMNQGTHKGAALRGVQARLGITAAQTVVFGDYLNDLEMLDAAEHSFAMTNAHPAVRERARHVAPANTDNGVVRTLAALLRIPMAALLR